MGDLFFGDSLRYVSTSTNPNIPKSAPQFPAEIHAFSLRPRCPFSSRLTSWDPVWWGAIVCLNIEMGATTPPFGVCLFVMKGVAPPNTTMGDIYRAAIPFLICDLIIMGVMIAFPQVSLWLPRLVR